ncbi:hypothetical protein PBI_PEREGRIN_46 [Rhodococcus phage Peregrin]|nr:hypothetical protein PBI_PEREGRIN_46 [Rhodococcus phage Peregrin]
MTEQYWKACIRYSDGVEEPIDAINYRVEVIDETEFTYNYESGWFPKPPIRLVYKNSHGAGVQIQLPPDAEIWKTFIQGDIWWLETNGERSSAYFDKLELALQLKTDEDEIKGGFVTTENPNK